jgi:hypothetical protein
MMTEAAPHPIGPSEDRHNVAVLTEAIFGLVGVVVGALVTGGVDFFLEWRRTDAEKKRVRRLVAGELQFLWVQLGITLETGTTPRVPLSTFEGRFLPDDLWLANRATLASALDDEQYGDLAGRYAAIDLFRRAQDELGPGAPLGTNLMTQAKDLQEHVEDAYEGLTGMTLGEEPERDAQNGHDVTGV